MVGGLLTIKLLSNMLSIEAFGRYALLFSVVTFLVAVLYTPLGQVNLRFAIIAQKDSALLGYLALQRRIFIVISGLSLLSLAGAGFWFGQSGFWAMLALTLAMGVQVTQQYLLMAFRKRRENGIAQLVGAVTRPAAVFLAIYLAGSDEVNAIYGLALGFLSITVVQIFYARKLPAETGELSFGVPNIAKYGGTYMLIGLVTITVFAADRWVLSLNGSLAQVAIYAALMQVALAPVAFSHAVLTRLVAPVFFKTGRAGQFRLLLLVWAGICVVVLGAAVAFPVLIVTILTNAEYAQYAYLLPWMVAGLMLERTAQVLEMKGSMQLRTGIYIAPRVAVVILVPVLELLVFHYWGFDWLVAGMVSATLIGAIGAAWANRRL